MANGELFVMITGIRMMLALFVAKWDFLVILLPPCTTPTLVLEPARFGWTMCVVPEVRVQL